MNRTALPAQLTLNLEAELEGRYTSLRECVASRVYARGLGRSAMVMDTSSSHLAEKLAGVDSADRPRGVTLDEFERYLKKTRDFEPIYYLVATYLRDRSAQQEAAQAEILAFFERFPGLAEKAGVAKQGRGRR